MPPMLYIKFKPKKLLMISPPTPEGSGGVSLVNRNGGSVGVGDSGLVAVAVAVGLGVNVGVCVGAAVDVGVRVEVDVDVAVAVAVRVGGLVLVAVGMGVWVDVVVGGIAVYVAVDKAMAGCPLAHEVSNTAAIIPTMR